jgi:hypothetical protein
MWMFARNVECIVSIFFSPRNKSSANLVPPLQYRSALSSECKLEDLGMLSEENSVEVGSLFVGVQVH